MSMSLKRKKKRKKPEELVLIKGKERKTRQLNTKYNPGLDARPKKIAYKIHYWSSG